MNKHCNNCKFAYIAHNFAGRPQGQHCWNSDYNDLTSNEQFSIKSKTHCQFWEFGTQQFQQRYSDAARGLIEIDSKGNIIDSQGEIIEPIDS